MNVKKVIISDLSSFWQTTTRRVSLLIFCGWLVGSLSACQTAAPSPWHWERAEAGLSRYAIVLSLAADPVDPARLWLGYYAPNGLATSQDGGQTWTLGAETGLADNPIFDLLALPPAPNATGGKLWAAARDGLRQSLDGGLSWQLPPDQLPEVTAFALDVDAANRLYVGLDDAGIYAERPDETGWESLAVEDSLASAAVLSLDVAPDGRQIYAGTARRGIFASIDGGQSWVNTYFGEYVPNLALNPNDPSQAVASLRTRLVRTRDGGQSWHTLPVPWASHEITSLLWLSDGRLGAGTGQGRLYQSLDGGDSWVEGSLGSTAIGSVLALTVAEARSPENAPQFLAGTWTGIYASDDGGQNWAKLAPELGTPNAHALLMTANGLLLGTQAGLFRWQADTGRWEAISSEAFPSGIFSLTAPSVGSNIVYAGTLSDGVYRSDDGGITWQSLPSLGVGVPALAVVPDDPDHVYMLAIWERVYESKNGGQNWRARWDGMGVTVEAASLTIDPARPLVYVGADTGLYRSHQGEDWQLVAPTLADQSVLALVTQRIPPASGGGSALYIGTTRGVYRSLDGGESVQHSEGNHLDWGKGLTDISVTSFLIDPAHPERIYAGTAYAGVYASWDWGQTWHPIGPPELEEEVVESLAWGSDGELFIATAGGVWRGVEP